MRPSPITAELTMLVPLISAEQFDDEPALVAETAVLPQYGPAAFGENAVTSRVAYMVTPLSIHRVTPDGSVSGPVMKPLPGPCELTTRRTANLDALYCGLASSSPETPAMLTLTAAAAFCDAVAVASAAAILAPTSASTAAPQASRAAWMRAWSGLIMVL